MFQDVYAERIRSMLQILIQEVKLKRKSEECSETGHDLLLHLGFHFTVRKELKF
jgi:hypothetical protein